MACVKHFALYGAGDASLYLTSKGKPTDYINYAAGPGKDMKALITTTPNFDDLQKFDADAFVNALFDVDHKENPDA